jgi:uncharacterized protein YjiK
MKFNRQFPCFLIIAGLLGACSSGKKKLQFTGSPRYDLLNPVTIKLPTGLDEISGIVYYPKDTSLFAIKDEDGIFYKIYLNRRNVIRKWRFDKKHDFEDLALHDSIFYVLISNGDIESLQFRGGDSIITSRSEFPGASKKINEFESLYYDDTLRRLVMFCKNCEDDNKKTVTAWGYDIPTGAYTPGLYNIDVQPAAKQLGKEKIKLEPSAAAINPVTNEIYILSSLRHLIVVTDRQGNFKELFELDPGIYKQPEGICFTPGGDLIISNEAHETGLANILIIKNKQKGL